MRRLTPGQEQRLEMIRRMSRMHDSGFSVPGTSIRYGLDPILGLVPVLGDFVSPLFTIGVLWQARDLGIPRVVQLRMIFNVAIDALLGIVPLAGDLFDVAWKANDMNVALLERHAYEEQRPASGDWLFVGGMMLLLLVIAVAPFFLFGWLMSALTGLFN
jgi:hypothetical protein